MSSNKEKDNKEYDENVRQIFSEEMEQMMSKCMSDILNGKPFNEEETKAEMKSKFDTLKYSAIRELKSRKNGKIEF